MKYFLILTKVVYYNMKIFKYQQWHLLSLVILLTMLFNIVRIYPSILEGSFLGISSSMWFLVGISSPIIHQLYVLLIWRLELYYKSISKLFGENSFSFYKTGFIILIFSRLVSIILLAISNTKTLTIDVSLSYLITGLLAIPAIYLFYSVKKYFGMDRAFGIDHFEPEVTAKLPFVKRGIFKYSSNGMYIYGFFILWIPCLIFQSKAALILALFNHIYIWAHYYFTELPDIKIIYKKRK